MAQNPSPGNSSEKKKPDVSNAKLDDLKHEVEVADGQYLTTNQGVRVNDDQNSLKAGDRGPTLMEDFIFREKMTHFDHERIPERVVHARGSGAHGVFKVYKPLGKYTKAAFLNDAEVETPVFVRFSTVAGSRGSTDLARDVRGFAVKFYTSEGNFDLVGNNIPVFFIQDAIKFPDLVHAVKPEPHNEIPQAASAHDTFWDFISLSPESTHMIMWLMSDRAIPRSYRMMEGFGVHTFRLINDKGEAHFVKFHWKPLLGVHSVVWDEAQQISGRDPDFHRRDLWEAIENGDFPQWELGLQIIPEADEQKYDFDLLDSTKIVPEELVPVVPVGKLTLTRNPDNFFAETEQVAYHIGHVVPGIDFTNDPLLQGRLFSYTDTQLIRLGGPNFHEIPINRPIAPLHNHQRDGYMRQQINRGRVSYDPNALGDRQPAQAKFKDGGFVSYQERIAGSKIRARSESFLDHYSQAAMFFHSQSAIEKKHIIDALRFELGKVETKSIRERMLYQLSQVDEGLAQKVAEGLGMPVPKSVDGPVNMQFGADAKPDDHQPKKFKGKPFISAALSREKTVKDTIKTRKVAALAADGVDGAALLAMKKALAAEGAMLKVVAPHGGTIKPAKGDPIPVDFALPTVASVLFDAVYIPGGDSPKTLVNLVKAVEFVEEAYKHSKAIAASGTGLDLLRETRAGCAFRGEKEASKKTLAGEGIIAGNDDDPEDLQKDFIKAIAQHRAWSRELKMDQTP